MKILVIGGTRNIGLTLIPALLEAGHSVTMLNRGRTPDPLPQIVERLQADRTDTIQFQGALAGRSFDVVVDNWLFEGDEAETVVKLLDGRVGHYIFISSGQVYLVREGIERPFREDDYAGRVMPPPKPSFGHEEWLYGMGKRRVEDTLARAWETRHFPYTTLRLPMVSSERDHYNRLYGYILRLQDGGPVLVPETPDFPLRHIYRDDVVRAIMLAIQKGAGEGRAYNISQDETISLAEYLQIVGDILDVTPDIATVKRLDLEANGFLPDCSPFSERWMSELTNDRSKTELGMTYTPLRTYLEAIVNHYVASPPPPPASYRRRQAEIDFGRTVRRG
ncbi:MAG: NAD-dependent epimerase/dehydratase family protein [Anaerolineaceae bacterium]|nr:NAD-dependent epimerase/dehydratase family protein [Anaerolineaceae bacterium]